MATGATYGSYYPVVGTIIGAIVGGLAAALIPGADGNRHMSLLSTPELSYNGEVNYSTGGYDYDAYRNRSITDTSTNPYYGSAFGALEDATNKAAADVWAAVDETLKLFPDDVAAGIKNDLEGLTFKFNEDRSWVLASDKFEEGMTNILTVFVEEIYDGIQPVIQKGFASYAQSLVEDKTITGLFDRLSENNILKTSLGDTSIFNADYGKAEGASFDTYIETVNSWLTSFGQLEAAFATVDTTIENILNPLTAFETGIAGIDTQFDSLKSTLYQLGAATTEYTALEEKRAEAIANYTEKYNADIETKLRALRSKWEKTNAVEMIADRYGISAAQAMDKGAIAEAYQAFIDDPQALVAVAGQFDVTTDQVISDLGTLMDAILDLGKSAEEFVDMRQARKDYSSFQMSLGGMDSKDVSLNQLGTQYKWGNKYGSTGDWDMEALYKDGIKPFLDMPFEDFQKMADSLGLSVGDLESEVNTLFSAFSDLTTEVESSMNTFKDLSESIRDQILGMQTSTDNQADVYERLGIQKGAISDMLGGQSISGYLGGLGSDSEKASAIQKLQELYGGELDLAQEAYQRPSDAYQGEYSTVLGGLNSLLEYSDLMKSEYQLQYEQTDYLKQIVENTNGLADIPKYADGGWTGSGGLAILHPNEVVLNSGQQAALTTQNNSGANVYITINATGGNSDEVANKAVEKLTRVLPSLISTGPTRIAVQNVSKGR